MSNGYAVYPTRWRSMKIEYTDEAITAISFTDEPIGGDPTELSEAASKQINEYFTGLRTEFDLPLAPQGTDFQQKVWEALQQIPFGETRTYKDIAVAIGDENASRAVGMANNKNPIAIVIPCHRVIGADGSLTGYAGGLEMKQTLLDLERGERKS